MEAQRENRSDIPYRQARQRNPAKQGMPSRSNMSDRSGMPNRQVTSRRLERGNIPNRQSRPRSSNAYSEASGNYRHRIEEEQDFDTYESRELERLRRNKAKARRRRKQQQRMLILAGMLGCFLILLLCLIGQVTKTSQKETPVFKEDKVVPVQRTSYVGEYVQGLPSSVFYTHPYWTEDFLSISEWARPGEELPEIKNIFVHYTANRNTSADQNRSYFEGLKDSHETAASAHFIIGYDGEVIQCIPLDEVGYAVKTRNYDSISIECCYKSEDGSFSQKTYDSLITLLKWLTAAYDLTEKDILRHYDCGGKLCPLYYTENPDEWEQLKKDVADR